jgi:hypothetical protein
LAAATGITIIKRFTYRGNASEEFSNTYWLKGSAPPATPAEWRALFDAIVLTEKTVYPAAVQVIRGYGYDNDDGHKPGDSGAVAPSVWQVDLRVSPDTPVAGTLATGGIEVAPGDAAVWVRWKTSRRTDPGAKPIYIRKYFHGALGNGTDPDLVATAQKTALLALGAKMDGGTLPGSRTITVAGQSDTIINHGCSTYITTRTLKRRSKRPTAP